MPPVLPVRLTLLLCVLVARHALAGAPAALHEKADALGLSAQPYWHLLLRYEKAGGQSGLRSEARSDHFFLGRNGRENPAQELHDLLNGLFEPDPLPDKSVACRFPARRAWIEENLQFTASRAECPQLKEWKAAISAAQATLVFASDYLNNPSSMFGHTFLRLDTAEQTEDTRLLAYAVNFAANAQADNPVVFAWKGLAGAYPGVFSLMPYYDKVKEYSDLENRDLWEYQLALTPTELDRLLDHLWELRSVEFPYYFLTRNCSFQLLGLLETARPGLRLRDAFPLQAIPTDTVRRVIAEPGLLRRVVYHPAAQRRLLQAAQDNSRTVNRAAQQLAEKPANDIGSLTPAEQAAALEAAYDYRYYRFLAGDHGPAARTDLRHLLMRRAALDTPSQRQAPPRPEVDPASGHETARIAMAGGQARKSGYIALRLRPAYHDLLDRPGGYRQGSHIDFLDTELRIDEQRQELRLERLAIVDIDSLAKRDLFFRPWSWFFGFGYRQAAVDSQGNAAANTSHGVAFADGGAGINVGLATRLECFLLLVASTEAGTALQDGGRGAAGGRGGCIYRMTNTRLRLQSDSRFLSDLGHSETRSQLEAHIDLGRQQALRLQAGRLQTAGQDADFSELAWIHYF
ncbi:MAG: hypothetical protein K0R03_645 [Moraxellaceae bacterium]|jgi:hypothetical protein|nr:hypothetical protein [Moraxellaceae bacterium]